MMFTKMSLKLKPSQFTRCIYNKSWTRSYCEYKSLYDKHEAGKQPRIVHGQPYPEWRKPWIQRDGEWTSKLSVFVENNPKMDVLTSMQHLPNLTFQDVRNWWAKMKVGLEIQNQKYLPERVASLGTNLAAVHFFTFRHAAVRLKGANYWIMPNPENIEKLPTSYTDGYFVEAVDCTNFQHNGLRFEGLQNLGGLNFLKWLSLKNQKHIDVWSIDRVAGQNGKTIEFLDISGCNLCVGGVIALARMTSLKFLVITDPCDNLEVQAALSILEEQNPKLLIKIVEPEVKNIVQPDATVEK